MTTQDVIRKLPHPNMRPLPAPRYTGTSGVRRIGLAVESMRRHMTDEGWQIFDGLASAGYWLCGYGLPIDTTDVVSILRQTKAEVAVVQDKREWDTHSGDFRDANARFYGIEHLKGAHDVFKLTILKDSHQRADYHAHSADEMGCHGWIVYYHPTIVQHMAPYVRPQHIIRTYHTVDTKVVPPFNPNRTKLALLSGALSAAYPLRQRLAANMARLPGVDRIVHPGYHRKGCATPGFLEQLSHYKVKICTASIYGYALRKIIEATACGCKVVTNLPSDDVLPEIDGNLTRISSESTPTQVFQAVVNAARDYNPTLQKEYSDKALAYYDYRVSGERLAKSIEQLRSSYCTTP